MMITRRWLGGVAAGLCAALTGAGQAWAIDAAAVPVGETRWLRLDTGESLFGRIETVDGAEVVLQHEVLGAVRVRLERVAEVLALSGPVAVSGPARTDGADGGAEAGAEAGTTVILAPAGAEGPAVAAEPVAEVAAPADDGPPSEATLSFTRGWKRTVAAGLNGADGNSENFSGRIAFDLGRVTDELETHLDSFYKFSTSEGVESENRGEVAFRHDWSFKDSPWGFFVRSKAEYDEFQDWDWRLSASAGPSYALIRTDKTKLKLRAGAGASREFGGDSNEIVPEAVFGFDLAHKFTERQSVSVSYDYLPNLDMFTQYRMNLRAAYEIVIDPKDNLTLKLGVDDRYDSAPGEDRRRNDIEYFALLGWSF
jgi:putative salt-induced outer membrane protein YdiY